jgi:hypothetical protein
MIGSLIALALAAPAALPGVWQGTVGDLPVRACFVQRESDSFGAYYYLSRGRTIALGAEEGREGAFVEGNGAPAGQPHWRIERADASILAGRWSGNGRTLPIRLTRLALPAGEESPCASLLFHRPRLAGVRIVRRRGAVDGVSFTKLALDTGGRFEIVFETFALDGESAAAQRINAALGQGLAGDPPHWLDCARDSLGQGPNEGAFEERLPPAMISRRWLSVAHHWDGFCGGAHPDSSNSYRLFDRSSGREVDLYDWLNESAVRREGPRGTEEEIKTLQPAFRAVILNRWRPEQAECEDVVRTSEFWNIGLTRRGFVLEPSLPHVVQACGETFTVSFDRLRPFLSEQGTANLRALLSEPPPR